MGRLCDTSCMTTTDVPSLHELCEELLESGRGTIEHVIGARLDLILSGGTYQRQVHKPCSLTHPHPRHPLTRGECRGLSLEQSNALHGRGSVAPHAKGL